MPLSRSRDYLSIGEVLEEVRADFPDISISKIRFLESEGLIEPERTPSGYRKFFPKDVDRLRSILSLQRDQFLPLKVIKDRIASGSNGGVPPAPAPVPGGGTPAPAPAAPPPPASDVSMTSAELAASAGLNERELAGLVEFGILDGSKDVYDGDDLVAARAAGGLFRFGVEPRHLKMYRNFAERESAFFEQIVSPVRSRKDPDAQREASRSITEIAALAQQFRDAMVRSKMRDLL
jgi:DNA-binding transcriptional MerR regulator